MASNDPKTWFPVEGGDTAATPKAATPSDDPKTWFPLTETTAATPEDKGYYDPIAGADIPPASTSSDLRMPTGREINAPIQALDERIIRSLEPPPGASAPDFYTRKAAAVIPHFLLSTAQIPGNLLTAATEQSPRIEGGQVVTPGATFNPETGTYGAKPESVLAATLLASPLRFGGGRVPLLAPNLLEASPQLPLQGNILSPDALIRARERADRIEGATTQPAPSTGVQVSIPEPPPPATAAEAKTIANNLYRQNAQQGNRMLPGEFTNSLIDDFKNALPKGAMEKAVAGTGPLEEIGAKLENLRDQPTTLEDAQRTYSRIGDAATAEFAKNKGPNETYRALMQIQENMRDRIAPPDLVGNDPWTLARKAWSQAMKMQDLEAIAERANGTQNPATSFSTQINNLVNNPSRIRGYSPEEVAALKAARDGGIGSLGDLLRTFGSRLLPIGAAAIEGASGGMLAGAGAGLVAHAGSSLMRRAATSTANRRIGNVMSTIARGVPRDPTLPPPILEGGNSLAAPLIPGIVNDLSAQYRNQ